MTENIKDYIEKKIEAFGEYDHYMIILSNALNSFARLHPEYKIRFGYSDEYILPEDAFRYIPDYFYLQYEIITYEDIRKGYPDGEYGLFVHMFNKHVDKTNMKKELNSFMNIKGEVCCSFIGDHQMYYRKNPIGVVLLGKATHTFSADVWSYTLESGLRVADRFDIEDKPGIRNESWIIPSQCQIVATIGFELPEYGHFVFSGVHNDHYYGNDENYETDEEYLLGDTQYDYLHWDIYPTAKVTGKNLRQRRNFKKYT